MRSSRGSVVVTGLVCLVFVASWQAAQAAEDAKQGPAVERTRKTVRMLDDVYKSAVVLITEHYVNDTDDLPAGSAAIALFDAVKKKGWHEVRLLDATGKPIEDKNSPQDAFEKKAVEKLLAGETWYDEVIEKDGQPMLPRRDSHSGGSPKVRHVPRPLRGCQTGPTDRRIELHDSDRIATGITGGPRDSAQH